MPGKRKRGKLKPTWRDEVLASVGKRGNSGYYLALELWATGLVSRNLTRSSILAAYVGRGLRVRADEALRAQPRLQN